MYIWRARLSSCTRLRTWEEGDVFGDEGVIEGVGVESWSDMLNDECIEEVGLVGVGGGMSGEGQHAL
jgi:hypothetical protein